MYGMDCERQCGESCLDCHRLDRSHGRIISLLRKARKIRGVRKIFIRSGIRHDLAVQSEEYVREVAEHHISGTLKIAPEHFSPRVLRLMNKSGERFSEFVDLFHRVNPDRKQSLRYYLMIGHPGDDEAQVRALAGKAVLLRNAEQFQLFTPTPMSVSSCIYWTARDPYTGEKVKVIRDYRTKKKLKRIMLEGIRRSHAFLSG
jgi:radical SAM superfamily enzyme YgiQ (UPF0313 family)